jgi:hypothetical protein
MFGNTPTVSLLFSTPFCQDKCKCSLYSIFSQQSISPSLRFLERTSLEFKMGFLAGSVVPFCSCLVMRAHTGSPKSGWKELSPVGSP